jgi:hypothetical protein
MARRHMRLIVDAARKHAGASIYRARFQPVLQRGASLFRDLELDRTAGLVLDNRRAVSHLTTCRDVVDPKANEIATAKLAVDGEIEHRQIAFAVLDLKPDTNGPGLFRPQGTLLSVKTAFVPWRTQGIAFRIEQADAGWRTRAVATRPRHQDRGFSGSHGDSPATSNPRRPVAAWS